jgi:hypothetical protein
VRLAFGAGINFVALENLKHFMLDVLPHSSGQLGYLQAAAVGGEGVGFRGLIIKSFDDQELWVMLERWGE